MMDIMNIMKNPVAAIAASKKQSSWMTFGILVIASVLAAIAVAIMVLPLAMVGGKFAAQVAGVPAGALAGAGIVGGIALLVLVLGIVMGLIEAFLVKTVMQILGGRGEYKEGLVVVAYPALIVSVGLLVASILGLIPIIGVFIEALIIMVVITISIATTFRAIKELFSVDYVTALIGLAIIEVAMIVAIYLTFISVFMANLSALGIMTPTKLGMMSNFGTLG